MNRYRQDRLLKKINRLSFWGPWDVLDRQIKSPVHGIAAGMLGRIETINRIWLVIREESLDPIVDRVADQIMKPTSMERNR